MSDSEEAYPAYMGRIHMRFSKGADPASSPVSPGLVEAYKDKGNIRSKYKGNRATTGSASMDDAEETKEAEETEESEAAASAAVGKTSGIPIFGEEGAADRAGWSKGHIAARNRMGIRLGVATENSHALGHADFGTDHELSAPAATKAQNTEQLAIELAMRDATARVNGSARQSDAGLSEGTSLVHAKITDVLHPKTGDLIARRYKLIRRADEHDQEGTVVFDHLMDGQRKRFSKKDAMTLGAKVHGAIMTGEPVDRSTKDHSANIKAPRDRKGLGAVAPTLEAADEDSPLGIKDHQRKVLDTLNRARGSTAEARIRSRMVGTQDRDGVEMVGPAFTDAVFPATAPGAGDGGKADGQGALDTLRERIAAGSDDTISPESLLVSGSLPADNRTKLLAAIGAIHASHAGNMEAGAAVDIGHGVHDELGGDAQEHLANSVAVSEPTSTDDPNWRFIDQTGKAVKALRRMEADTAGSGLSAVKESGLPIEHLQAAHARRNQYIGETKALLPVIPDDKLDEVDVRDASEATVRAASAGGDAEDAAMVGGIEAFPAEETHATPQLARAASLPLGTGITGAKRRARGLSSSNDDTAVDGAAAGGFLARAATLPAEGEPSAKSSRRSKTDTASRLIDAAPVAPTDAERTDFDESKGGGASDGDGEDME